MRRRSRRPATSSFHWRSSHDNCSNRGIGSERSSVTVESSKPALPPSLCRFPGVGNDLRISVTDSLKTCGIRATRLVLSRLVCTASPRVPKYHDSGRRTVSVHRNAHRRLDRKRFGTNPSSAGSDRTSGPCGFRATRPSEASSSQKLRRYQSGRRPVRMGERNEHLKTAQSLDRACPFDAGVAATFEADSRA